MIYLKTEKNDTTRITIYQDIVLYYSVNDLNKSNKYSDSLFSLVKKIKYPKAEMNYYVLKGILEYRRSNFKNAIKEWKKGLENPEVEENFYPRISMISNIAVAYKNLVQNDSFVKYSEMGLKLNRVNNNTTGLLANYYTLADYYLDNRDIQLASNYTNELVQLAISENDYASLSRAHVIFASLNRLEYQFEESISEFQEALRIYETHFPENITVPRSLKYEIAKSFIAKKDFLEASEILKNILSLIDDNNISENFLSQVKMELLRCHIRLNEETESDNYYNEIKKGIALKTPYDSINFISVIAEYEISYNKYNKKTLESLLNGYDLFLTYRELGHNFDLSGLLSTFYRKNKDFKNAYKYLSLNDIYKDSLRTIRNATINLYHQRKFEEIKNQNTILNQEKELQNREIEIQSKQIIILITSFVGSVLALVLVYLYLRKQKRKQKQKQLEKAFTNGFSNYLEKKYNLKNQELEFWKMLIDDATETKLADHFIKSIDTIKRWRKILYRKFNNIHEVDGNYTKVKATNLYKKEKEIFKSLQN